MKRFTILFIMGLFVEVCAFFISQFDNIPFVLRVISPKYYHAINGLNKLESSMVLNATDEGFGEFQELFLELLRKQNPPENVSLVHVLKFQREGAMMSISTKRTKEVIPIRVFLSNGQDLNWNLEELSNSISNLKRENMFVASIFIFVFGVFMQIIGFVFEIIKKA